MDVPGAAAAVLGASREEVTLRYQGRSERWMAAVCNQFTTLYSLVRNRVRVRGNLCGGMTRVPRADRASWPQRAENMWWAPVLELPGRSKLSVWPFAAKRSAPGTQSHRCSHWKTWTWPVMPRREQRFRLHSAQEGMLPGAYPADSLGGLLSSPCDDAGSLALPV